jgi:hypothetical protein
MRGLTRGTGIAACLAVVALRLAAQDTAPPPQPADTTQRDSAVAVRPPEPNADQLRYLRGLRTVARGVAQLRSGVDRVGRAEGARDTTRLRQAGRLLAGLCGTARTFMTQGRATMQPTVYEDSARVKARRLVLQVDSLIKSVPACETGAAKAPARTAGELLNRLRSYETALQEFRSAVAAPAAIVPAPQP